MATKSVLMRPQGLRLGARVHTCPPPSFATQLLPRLRLFFICSKFQANLSFVFL